MGDAYAEAIAENYTDRAMASECAGIAREFPGWSVTWTTRWGFRASKNGNEIGPCTSRSAIRCLLAVTEFHRMAT